MGEAKCQPVTSMAEQVATIRAAANVTKHFTPGENCAQWLRLQPAPTRAATIKRTELATIVDKSTRISRRREEEPGCPGLPQIVIRVPDCLEAAKMAGIAPGRDISTTNRGQRETAQFLLARPAPVAANASTGYTR